MRARRSGSASSIASSTAQRWRRRCSAIAQSIATGPALALGNVKRLLRESSGRTLSEQLHAEAESFGRCAATDDFAEGIRAFLDKRPPRFR